MREPLKHSKFVFKSNTPILPCYSECGIFLINLFPFT